jgi:hypothetical protein
MSEKRIRQGVKARRPRTTPRKPRPTAAQQQPDAAPLAE